MARLLIEELRSIEGADTDPSLLSATVVRLILSSRQIETTVYDSDARTGTYVLVLEGTLEIGEREQASGDEAQAMDGPPTTSRVMARSRRPEDRPGSDATASSTILRAPR